MEDREKYYFSSNLKHLRNLYNINQEEIGKICNKSKPTISLWEKGERDVDILDAIKISRFFNISLDDLTCKDLRFDENVKLNDELKADHIIMDNIKELSEAEKEQLIGIMNVIRSKPIIKGSDSEK